jgi:photosystem II stability/assembly factor-like uncharacterized protein
VYVATADYSDSGGALWKSTDGGTSWRNLFPSSLTDVFAVAVNSQIPDTIYAATGTGVVKSTDGGENWMQIPDSPHFIGLLAIDPQDANTLYAGGLGGLYAITFGS